MKKPSVRIEELYLDNFGDGLALIEKYLDEIIPEIERQIKQNNDDAYSMYKSLCKNIDHAFDEADLVEKRINIRIEELEKKVDQLSNPKTEPVKDPYRIDPIKPCEATKDGKHEWIGIPHTTIAECKHCGERQSWGVIYNKCLNRETGRFEPIFPEPKTEPVKEEAKTICREDLINNFTIFVKEYFRAHEMVPECEHEWEGQAEIGKKFYRKCNECGVRQNGYILFDDNFEFLEFRWEDVK